MDQMTDQLDTQSITNGIEGIDIHSNSSDMLNSTIIPLMNEMKDKCESMVKESNYSDDRSDSTETHDYRRDIDSEADQSENLETQSEGTIKDNDAIKVTIVSTDPNEDQTTGPLTLHGKPRRQMKPRTEKWGESVGIIDESGHNKRVISLNELHNYLILETFQRFESKIYCSLINERYPRFFDSTIDYLQRWRMRYNIFVDKVFVDNSDESLVHIGELHLYFDLIPRFVTPYYVNNSFYSNPNDSEKPLDVEKYQKMKSVFEGLRKSPSIYQLKFPIRGYLFHNTDHIFDKFKERHHEILDESRTVYRKNFLRKQRQKSDDNDSQSVSQTTVRSGMSRSDRDFGQSSRDFHQTGRKFPQNAGKFSEMSQSSDVSERQDSNYSQRSVASNNSNRERGYKPRGNRTFSANSRKPLHTKPMNGPPADTRRRRDTENSIEADVTFEDTRERHERSGHKFRGGKTHKSNQERRLNEQRMDAFRDDRAVRPKDRYRSDSRSMDSEYRQNRGSFSSKGSQMSMNYMPTPAAGPLFSTDLEKTHIPYNPNIANIGRTYTHSSRY